MGYSNESEGCNASLSADENDADGHVMAIKAGVVDRLKMWRAVVRLSQDDYAAALKLNPSLIKKYESKKGAVLPGALSLYAMAEQGLNVHWLLIGQGRMAAPMSVNNAIDSSVLEMQLRLEEIQSALSKLATHEQEAVIDAMVKKVNDALDAMLLNVNEAVEAAEIQRAFEALKNPKPPQS